MMYAISTLSFGAIGKSRECSVWAAQSSIFKTPVFTETCPSLQNKGEKLFLPVALIYHESGSFPCEEMEAKAS